MTEAESIFRDFLREHDVGNWPSDEEGDPLDTENLMLISVSEAGVEFCCGGDWQTPRRLLLRPDFTVASASGLVNFPDIEVDRESLENLAEWLAEPKRVA